VCVLTITRRQIALLVVPLVAVLALAGTRLARTGAAQSPAEPAPLVASADTGREQASSRLYVHVVGAVRQPGLYRLREGARVADAIRKAGGSGPRADVALVNLAAPVADGMQVVVPLRAVPGQASASGSGAATPTGPVSLASATLEQLDELPGIGPVTAQKIVDWRQAHGSFSSVDDLDQIPGIGPARVEQLRDLVTP
jgi:competence protein ComEA